MRGEYDIIVVGGGHAGCEAAMAASNLGSSVLLITMDALAFAKMSCNPAVGGIAKGQIVREIDALLTEFPGGKRFDQEEGTECDFCAEPLCQRFVCRHFCRRLL